MSGAAFGTVVLIAAVGVLRLAYAASLEISIVIGGAPFRRHTTKR